MQVIKATGLVPVRGLVRSQHPAGVVFGLSPELARKAVQEKRAELYPIPPDVETFEADGPSIVASEVTKPAPTAVDAIAIPDLWDAPQREGGLHWVQVVKLAESIKGGTLDVPDGMKPKEVAEAIIRDELARRAAAETEPAA